MSRIILELDTDLVEILKDLDQPLPQVVRELMVVELYRRELISLGKAAELLGMPLLDFIRYSGQLVHLGGDTRPVMW